MSLRFVWTHSYCCIVVYNSMPLNNIVIFCYITVECQFSSFVNVNHTNMLNMRKKLININKNWKISRDTL